MPTPATSTTGTIAATEHTVWDQVTLKSFMDQAFADAKREGILPGTEIPRHKNPFSQKGQQRQSLFQLDKARASLLDRLIDSVAKTFDDMFPDCTFQGKNSFFEASIDYEPAKPPSSPTTSAVRTEIGIPLTERQEQAKKQAKLSFLLN